MLSNKKGGVRGAALLGCCSYSKKKGRAGGAAVVVAAASHSRSSCCCHCWWCRCWYCHHCSRCSQWGCMTATLLCPCCPHHALVGKPLLPWPLSVAATAAPTVVATAPAGVACILTLSIYAHLLSFLPPLWAIPLLLWLLLLVLVPLGLCIHTPSMYVRACLGPPSLSVPCFPHRCALTWFVSVSNRC